MKRRSFISITTPLVLFGPLANRSSVDNMYALSTVLPFLEQAKAAGCVTIIDCTAAYFGRNALVLKTLSEKSGINIVTNTGIYGAANGRYIPKYVQIESPEQIASRWIHEWKNGIGTTRVRPGFMKLGFNSGSLTAVDKKLLQAAALTHLASGLTIAAHTSNNPASAFEQLEILRHARVSPSAWIWTHAHDVRTNEPLFEAARRGAWISFDGYCAENHERYLETLKEMKRVGYLNQVLVSHDGDGYPQRGRMPSKLTIDLLKYFLPALSNSGLHNLIWIKLPSPILPGHLLSGFAACKNEGADKSNIQLQSLHHYFAFELASSQYTSEHSPCISEPASTIQQSSEKTSTAAQQASQ